MARWRMRRSTTWEVEDEVEDVVDDEKEDGGESLELPNRRRRVPYAVAAS